MSYSTGLTAAIMTTSKPLDLHDHRTMLESESGIHPDLIKARGYQTVTRERLR